MAKLLDGKAAIVTGASQGLGLAIATALAVDGAKVLMVARNAERVAEAAVGIGELGGEVVPFPVDITRLDAVEEVAGKALAAFGRIDILVNNAGVFVWKSFFELEAEDWERTLATNLSAPFRLTRAAAKRMADQGTGGSIINIASIHGRVADPNLVPHCASKFGLIGLTRATADALREYDIRVNAIAPGAIEPNSKDRWGEAPTQRVTQADIASLVVYLSSNLSRSITGSVIEMYGSTRSVIQV